MSAALKYNLGSENLSQKLPLGENRAKLRLVWENPKLSADSHREKSEVKLRLVSGQTLYAYVENNPLNAIDPLGLDTLILYGMGILSNPAGHSALAFTDQGVYSYGTSQPFGSSVTDYIKDQASYRDTIAIVLKTTPQQEQTMIGVMKSASGSKYDFLKNNCATTNKKALEAAGISSPILEIPLLPITMRDIGWSQPGSTSYFIPQGGSLPSQLEQFNPRQ